VQVRHALAALRADGTRALCGWVCGVSENSYARESVD